MIQDDDLLVHFWKRLLIQAGFEDIVDRAVAGTPDLECTGACGFNALVWIFAGESLEAQTGSVTLFGMLVPRQDFADQLAGCRSNGRCQSQ